MSNTPEQENQLSPEDLARVEKVINSGYNSVERKPFRPMLLLLMVFVVLTVLSLLSLLIAKLNNVI